MQSELDAMKFLIDEKHKQQDMTRWTNVTKYRPEGPRARTCQYMAGEDHVKCGKPVERDSYCGPCWAKCHVPYALKPREVYR